MKISFTTNTGNLNLSSGFGVAGYGMVTSLQALGHEVIFQDPTAPVEIAFCQPDYSEWSNPNAYHIQYTPWESDEVSEDWGEAFNNNCDEVWTTSPLVAKWFAKAGVTKPIWVYQHGVPDGWKHSRLREDDGVTKFLHIGEPAPRKGGQLTVDAFREAFGNSTDVHLTIKAWNRSTLRVYTKSGSIVGSPHKVYNNISLEYNEIPQEEMIELVLAHDVLVYPSYGEGFGLIPLQAMATGMPVICTEAWAPYKRFISPDLRLGSRIIPSPWPRTHFGNMYEPSRADLVESMKKVHENYGKYAYDAFQQVPDLYQSYDWVGLTKGVFAHVEKLIEKS